MSANVPLATLFTFIGHHWLQSLCHIEEGKASSFTDGIGPVTVGNLTLAGLVVHRLYFVARTL